MGSISNQSLLFGQIRQKKQSKLQRGVTAGLFSLMAATAPNTAKAATGDTLSLSTSLDVTATSSTQGTNVKKGLKGPAFAPTDFNLFTPQTYSTASEMVPAAAPSTPVTEQQLKKQVSNVSGNAGVKVLSDSTLKAKISDPRLLAALATLSGTPLSGAIDAIKSDAFSSVEFGQPPAGDGAIAQSVDDGTGTGHRKIIINSKYQHEDIRLFGTSIGHESLHQDDSNTNKEELIITGLDALTYAHFVKKDPSLASKGTELTRRYNTKLMALVNSRDENGKLHLLSARELDENGNPYTVYPGTTSSDPLKYFGQRFVDAGLGSDTTGNSALKRAIEAVTNKELSNAAFDDATLNTLDQKIKLFSDSDWLEIAEALKLDVGH
jgi:hypothetical protein